MRRTAPGQALRAGERDDSLKKDATGSYIWGFHTETPSERKLSAAMRKAGLKFGQEVPVKGFTVDFLLGEWLVVEVDGESHLVSGMAEKDASRQRVLEGAGFTVLRVPAGDLSTQSGLTRWIKQIKEKVEAGPPYLALRKFSNDDYKRQLEQVKKALAAGEEEKRKREALAFGPSNGREKGNGRSKAGGDEESMEDYFGKKGQDFGSMLKSYDWGKTPSKEDREERSRGRHNPPRRPR